MYEKENGGEETPGNTNIATRPPCKWCGYKGNLPSNSVCQFCGRFLEEE